jgi:hypothetical protein
MVPGMQMQHGGNTATVTESHEIAAGSAVKHVRISGGTGLVY